MFLVTGVTSALKLATAVVNHILIGVPKKQKNVKQSLVLLRMRLYDTRISAGINSVK